MKISLLYENIFTSAITAAATHGMNIAGGDDKKDKMPAIGSYNKIKVDSDEILNGVSKTLDDLKNILSVLHNANAPEQKKINELITKLSNVSKAVSNTYPIVEYLFKNIGHRHGVKWISSSENVTKAVIANLQNALNKLEPVKKGLDVAKAEAEKLGTTVSPATLQVIDKTISDAISAMATTAEQLGTISDDVKKKQHNVDELLKSDVELSRVFEEAYRLITSNPNKYRGKLNVLLVRLLEEEAKKAGKLNVDNDAEMKEFRINSNNRINNFMSKAEAIGYLVKIEDDLKF